MSPIAALLLGMLVERYGAEAVIEAWEKVAT